jgi:hypothetical protein
VDSQIVHATNLSYVTRNTHMIQRLE